MTFLVQQKKKIKKVKYKSNGITLQNAVSLLAQDFLNKRYDKTSLKTPKKFGVIEQYHMCEFFYNTYQNI